MSCCNNKKKTEETGVHLTERTCSPYNPIIKLIVDDCLGLPIYPVTSIDAVIDEEGNTLRNLLDELSELASTGGSSVLQLLDKINTIEEKIQNIENSYLTENSLLILDIKNNILNLKNLIYAISSMNRGENYIYADGSKPYIVKVIEDIKAIIGDGSSEEDSIINRLNKIELLLIAIAEFNDNYEYNDRVIPIIKKILDLEQEFSGLGNLLGQLANLSNKVDHIKEELEDALLLKADLTKLNDGRKYLVKEQYPVTSISVITSYAQLNPLETPLVDGEVYYTGNLEVLPVFPGWNRYDVAPLTFEKEGTWEVCDASGNPITNSAGKVLYAGDASLSIAEVLAVIDAQTANTINVEGKTLNPKELYIKLNGERVLMYDFNGDGEVTGIADINEFLSLIISMKTSNGGAELTLDVPGKRQKQTLYKWDSNLGFVEYPIIDGKLYKDKFTGELLTFGKLRSRLDYSVIYIGNKIEGNGVINVEQELVKGSAVAHNNDFGVYKQYTISADLSAYELKDNTNPHLKSTNFESNVLENVNIEPEKINFGPALVSCRYVSPNELLLSNHLYIKPEILLIARKVTILETESSTNSLLYSIDDVSDLIDILLHGTATIVSKTSGESLYNYLIQELTVIKDNLGDSGTEGAIKAKIAEKIPTTTFDIFIATSPQLTQIQAWTLNDKIYTLETYDSGSYSTYELNLIKVAMCDIDGDGEITISDVTTLIDKLLSNNADVEISKVETGNQLYYGNKRVISGSNDLDGCGYTRDELIGRMFYAINVGKFYYYDSNSGGMRPLPEYSLTSGDKFDYVVLCKDNYPVSIVDIVKENNNEAPRETSGN